MYKVRNGFSLAEMMIVMLVLTVILAAATPIITKRAAQSVTTTSTTLSIPAGVIMPYGGTNLPTGDWLWCSGANVSRTTYSKLFAAISTNYGVGDGSTTFTLPDFRGVFLRGNDNGRGVDPSRGLGSLQTDAGRNITGNMYGIPNDYNSGGDGAFGENTTFWSNVGGGSSSTGGNYSFDASRQWGATHIATEFRPINSTVNYIIKY